MFKTINVYLKLLCLLVSGHSFATVVSIPWETLLKNKAFDQIQSNAHAILKIDSTNQDALYYQAVAFYKSYQRDKSAERFKQLILLFEQNPNTISSYRHAMIHYYLGNNVQAIQLLNKTVLQKDSPLDAQTHLGYAYAKIGEFKAAIKAYDAVIKHTQDHSIYYNRAMAYYGAGQQQAAAKDMENSIKQKPSFHLPYYDLIALYVTLKQPKKALKLLDTLLARGEKNLSRLTQDPDLKTFVVDEAYVKLLKKYGL
jgi:tetratricopeptide (TPR) repeat protein